MQKKRKKSLELKKVTIAKVDMHKIRGGGITPSVLCVSQIYAGEDVCVSINQN